MYFWHADKHRSFLQGDIIILGVCSQACLKYPKREVCISLYVSKENVGDENDFLPADKHESFHKLIVSVQCAYPGMPKVPKITSFEYLFNISRKT